MRRIKAVVKRNYPSKMALILAPAISIPNHEPVGYLLNCRIGGQKQTEHSAGMIRRLRATNPQRSLMANDDVEAHR
jgi:hypothetical protein